MTPNIALNITVTTPEAAIALIQALNLPCEREVAPQVGLPMPPAAAAVAAAENAAVPSFESPVVSPTCVPDPPPAPAAPAATVPTSAPAYTFDDLARAAGPLMDAGKTAELQGLLRSFNVQALTQLPKEQYGAFATVLRGLGARI